MLIKNNKDNIHKRKHSQQNTQQNINVLIISRGKSTFVINDNKQLFDDPPFPYQSFGQ